MLDPSRKAFVRRRFPTLLASVLLGAALLGPSVAYAGEIVIGAEPLPTDDQGKLTAEGRKKAAKELPSEPGEELWQVHVWAKIDKGAPGPLYVEFEGKLPDGKPYKVPFRHEKPDYEGEKFVSMDFEIEGNHGFNKGKTYDVKLVQVGTKGNDLILARDKVTLTYTEPKAEQGDGAGDTDGGDTEGDDQADAQDELDTLVGGEEPAGDSAGPPPVEPPGKKKGCSVGAGQATGAMGIPAALGLFALGAALGRRRRD